jgi:Tol biopolymer transport system component
MKQRALILTLFVVASACTASPMRSAKHSTPSDVAAAPSQSSPSAPVAPESKKAQSSERPPKSGARTRRFTETTGPAISADGRFVAYLGYRPHPPSCVGIDGLGSYPCQDVFLYDRVTSSTTLVSKSSSEVPGNGDSGAPALSADGRYIAFASDASNLVPNDTNSCQIVREDAPIRSCDDIFVRDRVNHTTTRVSVSGSGAQSNGYSFGPSISGDGRFVAFSSFASNLAPAHASGCNIDTGANEESPGCPDVLVHDLLTGSTEVVSFSPSGSAVASAGASISTDGSLVLFLSSQTTPPTGPDWRIYIRDRSSGVTTNIPTTGLNNISTASLSGNGRYVVFWAAEGSSCDRACVYRYDRSAGELALAGPSRSGSDPNGEESLPSISFDGRYVAFDSSASDLVASEPPCRRSYCEDVYRHDMSGHTSLVSSAGRIRANGYSDFAAISGDGSVVAFQSGATNLSTDPDGKTLNVFVRDLASGTTVRLA